MVMIKGDPEKRKKYRAHKQDRLAKTAPARKAAAKKKAAANQAEAK